MDDSAANKLPEADSLPDGFVESSTEPLAPLISSTDPGRQLDYREDKLLGSDTLKNSSNEIVANESGQIEGKTEKTHKFRTFPVPLSDRDGYDASGESAEVSDGGCIEQKETLITSEPSASAFATSAGCKLTVNTVEEKGKDQGEFKTSEKLGIFKNLKAAGQGGFDIISDQLNDEPSSEYQKNRKETPEVKRRSSKRTFKTEKEFLEFTLKYQQVLAERDAAISVRDKLESLCRELQRQNKKLMEECRRVSEEGQNLRSDLSNKFNDAIKNVSTKLDEQKDECISQLKENEMLRDKLKQLADQHTLSEQHHARQLKQKELELKIAELKSQQHEQKLAQEQAQMKLYAEQVSQLLATEKNLRSQLTADGEKFQQFQDALVKSNEVFETYKQEIEKMVKSTKELRRENTFLKSKCQKSDFTLVELVEERERMKKELEKTKKQKEKLESLCRSLQAERKQQSDGK